MTHLYCNTTYKETKNLEKKFSDLIPTNGYLIGCAEDNRVLEVLNYAKCNTISYGITKGDVTASNISFNTFP